MGYKIPRISVHADFSEDAEAGEISTLSVGYGLHQAWIYTTLFGTSSVFGIAMGKDGLASSPVFMISIIVYALSLIALGVFDQKLLRFVIDKRSAIFAAALMSVGTLLILFCDGDCPYVMLIDILAGVSTGLGSAILIEFWGTSFARTSSTSIVLNTAIAIVVAMATYGIILHMIPSPYSGAAAAVLPWIEIRLLWKHTPKPYLQRRELPIFAPLPVNRGRFFVLMLLPLLLLGYPLGYMREQSVNYMMPRMDIASQVPLLAAAGLATIIVITCGLAIMNDDRADALMRPLLPLIALALFFIPMRTPQGNPVASIVVMTGYMCFEGLLWIVLGSFSQRYRISPVLIFGIGRGSLAAGAFLGANSADAVTAIAQATGYQNGAVVAIALICMITGFALMPHERDIRRAVSAGKGENPLFDAVNVEDDKACEATEKIPASENKPTAHTPTGEETGKKTGRFRRKCEAVANRYLLSVREAEVLFFLAKGHNAAYLQEKLFISEGTAKTHIRHIYAKTNVHNQQELMRLVEETDTEDGKSAAGSYRS